MRIILIYFFVLSILPQTLQAKDNKPDNKFLGCNNKVSEKYQKNFNTLKIDQIEVDVHNYRNWIVNGVRILTSRSRFVSEKFKQRYHATISVKYHDATHCIFKGRIRHHGDEKDHIDLFENTILQSIDVHLDTGNIKGITRFKLLRPNTRGKLEDEVFLTELLRNLNYLAPRTAKVEVRINKAISKMIFQEKAAKELLEFNNRREGPILEGDERFFFKAVEKLPSNQKSNWEIGVVPIMNKSIKHLLAKQVNSNIINKSESLKKMSFNATTNLNLIYLYYSNKFQDEKNNFHYFDYDLDNNLLGFFDPKNVLKLDIYNLLIQSTNSQHGLAVNNRKFFWNSLENYFEPINYDSNPNIGLSNPITTTASYRLPISENFFSAFKVLKTKLLNIDKKNIKKNISTAGVDLTQETVNQKFEKIIINLDRIEEVYLNIDNDEILEHNKFKPINNLLVNFNDTLNDVDSSVILVKQNNQSGSLQRCKIFLSSCKDYNFSQDNLEDLLEGELILNEKLYQYLGNSLNFENIKRYRNFNKINIENSTFYFEDGIYIQQDINENELKIIQTEVGSRAYFIGGKLKNFKIKYQGKKLLNQNTLPKNYPNDINGLTGCLSFINLNVENISLESKDSNCEDAVNFINTTGSISKILIENSFSDGLDVDYSNLYIDDIFIDSSKNDCVDFSAGNYNLNNLKLNNCGDKALSVGESSNLNLNYVEGNNSEIGIASKDSSIVISKNLNFNNVKICLSAYNKKQEFNGGIIKFDKDINCKNFITKFESDKFSKIIQQDNLKP